MTKFSFWSVLSCFQEEIDLNVSNCSLICHVMSYLFFLLLYITIKVEIIILLSTSIIFLNTRIHLVPVSLCSLLSLLLLVHHSLKVK